MQRTAATPVEKVPASGSKTPWLVALLALAVVTVGPVIIHHRQSAAAHSSGEPPANPIEAPGRQPQPDQAATAPLDSASGMAVVRERHRSALAQHDGEPADPSWAQEMSSFIRRRLVAAAAGGGFKVLGVDCRSRTCVASVDWESASAAYGKWQAVVQGNYERCGVEVVLDEPVAAQARFGTKVLFPCR